VTLFVDRAQAVDPEFAVTEANTPVLAEICRRLDGLPLAIELAAAHIRLLTPQALASRLGRRLQLLKGGPRDVSARQQTLRATIDWSYDLLETDEQTLFARLAIFAGGCTLEAAEAICDPGTTRTCSPASPPWSTRTCYNREMAPTAIPACTCWRPSVTTRSSGLASVTRPTRSPVGTPTTI
jgi:hypothetical protein